MKWAVGSVGNAYSGRFSAIKWNVTTCATSAQEVSWKTRAIVIVFLTVVGRLAFLYS